MKIAVAVWDPSDKKFKETDEFVIGKLQVSYFDELPSPFFSGPSSDKATLTLIRKSDVEAFNKWLTENKSK